jgi:hypothetical protein
MGLGWASRAWPGKLQLFGMGSGAHLQRVVLVGPPDQHAGQARLPLTLTYESGSKIKAMIANTRHQTPKKHNFSTHLHLIWLPIPIPEF